MIVYSKANEVIASFVYNRQKATDLYNELHHYVDYNFACGCPHRLLLALFRSYALFNNAVSVYASTAVHTHHVLAHEQGKY
jgi:hypothetical protein